MKIAVASQGTGWSSRASAHFGRAPHFVIVDLQSGAFSVCDNTGCRRTGHSAGMQAAGVLMSLGVNAVITGNIGPKAFATLQAGRVEVYRSLGEKVRKAIDKFKAAQLPKVTEANVRAHGARSPAQMRHHERRASEL